MAVVINDIEVVLDPPSSQLSSPAGEEGPAPSAPAAASPPMSPVDLFATAMHIARRRERVRAH
jgi:hypothetical protein